MQNFSLTNKSLLLDYFSTGQPHGRGHGRPWNWTKRVTWTLISVYFNYSQTSLIAYLALEMTSLHTKLVHRPRSSLKIIKFKGCTQITYFIPKFADQFKNISFLVSTEMSKCIITKNTEISFVEIDEWAPLKIQIRPFHSYIKHSTIGRNSCTTLYQLLICSCDLTDDYCSSSPCTVLRVICRFGGLLKTFCNYQMSTTIYEPPSQSS